MKAIRADNGIKRIVLKRKILAITNYKISIWNIFLFCLFNHYPNPQAFFDSVKRCLRPGGRLVLRDVTSDNKLLLWFMDKIELPLANLCGHGDVTIATREVVTDCCKKAGLKVEKLEIRKGMRMHCVVSK